MRNLIIGTVVGLLLGFLLSLNVATVEAQNPQRMYGTNSTTGAAAPVQSTGGAIHISLQ